MDKLIVNKVEVQKGSFELRRLYNVKRFMKEIKERLKQIPADYIEFNCDTNDACDVYMTFYTGRDETDEEFGERMLRKKWEAADLILSQDKAEYIKYLSLKAKFE